MQSWDTGIIDMGGSDSIYENTAIRVAEYVTAGNADRGVLVCGTGIGMSIAAIRCRALMRR